MLNAPFVMITITMRRTNSLRVRDTEEPGYPPGSGLQQAVGNTPKETKSWPFKMNLVERHLFPDVGMATMQYHPLQAELKMKNLAGTGRLKRPIGEGLTG